jgi:hypothetical protein
MGIKVRFKYFDFIFLHFSRIVAFLYVGICSLQMVHGSGRTSQYFNVMFFSSIFCERQNEASQENLQIFKFFDLATLNLNSSYHTSAMSLPCVAGRQRWSTCITGERWSLHWSWHCVIWFFSWLPEELPSCIHQGHQLSELDIIKHWPSSLM